MGRPGRTERSGSAEGCDAELVERKLGRRLPAALGAVLDVSPRAQETGPVRVEHDHEGLRVRIELESEVGPPGRGRIPGVEVQSLQDAAKTHARGVEKPGAVARLENERHIGDLFHTAILPEGNDK